VIKRFYFDLETSGLNPVDNAILQLSAIIEINGEVKETINLYIKPFTSDIVEQEAIEVNKLDYNNDKRFVYPRIAFKTLIDILDRYIDKYDRKDKFYMVGYNCQHFDKEFLHAWFVKNDNKYMYSYFYPETLDLFILMGYACQNQRHKLDDLKLLTVAKSLGLTVDEEKLHDASYDVELVYDLYTIFSAEYPI